MRTGTIITAGRARRIAALALVAFGLAAVAGLATPSAQRAAGPPFPEPVFGQAVYDTAGVFRPETIDTVERMIDAIEDRVGAEIVVYTQVVPYGVSTSEAEQHAIALMDQWGVGRAGFDDGLVILFDLHEGDTCHGQVQLYAGPGYRATYLSNEDRQRIFDDEMLPHLRQCDLDEALLVAMNRVDANATPEYAGRLGFARILDALLGLVLAPFIVIGLVGGGILRWYRQGRDPHFLDSPSIHLPAPPPGLTPAAAAVVLDGRSSRRALTAALLDLAARGELGFRQSSSGLFGLGGTKLSIELGEAVAPDPEGERIRQRAERRPLSQAERHVKQQLRSIAGKDNVVQPDDLPKFGRHVSKFDQLVEAYTVSQHWFREPPSKVSTNWAGYGFGLLVLAAIAFFVALEMPSGGLTVVAGALALSGVAMFPIGYVMPARTKEGAKVRVMLHAYRRTLEKTMAMSRSMDQVVEQANVPVVGTPDEAVVWGVALGLQDRVEGVLKRTADDLRNERVQDAYVPRWYVAGSTGPSGSTSSGGSGGWAPGLMSASALPSFGGMMAALSTVGNSPSSSGSGSGGGGFSGGSSGGGGGGSGGGF
jgi:uncharacterized membrane protein YgcG